MLIREIIRKIVNDLARKINETNCRAVRLFFRNETGNMKRCLMVVPLIAVAMFFSGCLGLNSGLTSGGSGGSGDSSVSSGIDPITQAGIDADNAATNDQSNQDIRDATAAAIAASASQ